MQLISGRQTKCTKALKEFVRYSAATCKEKTSCCLYTVADEGCSFKHRSCDVTATAVTTTFIFNTKSFLMLLRAYLLTAIFGAVVSFDHPRVHCTTTKGPLVIEVYRDWSPLGADRFLELVKDGFYTDIAFYRCVRGFLTQFGISEDKSKKHWHRNQIQDDPNLHLGIKKNYVSYAGGGPNTRSTQLFIAFEDLDFLGKEPWETPFGRQR
jgi:cyclophilin family peptidyl-prolyl cis-trans isomerase